MGGATRSQAQQRGVGPDLGGHDTPDQLFREASPAPTTSLAPAPLEPSPSSNKPLPAPPSEARQQNNLLRQHLLWHPHV
jgi:hypothetical protein